MIRTRKPPTTGTQQQELVPRRSQSRIITDNRWPEIVGHGHEPLAPAISSREHGHESSRRPSRVESTTTSPSRRPSRVENTTTSPSRRPSRVESTVTSPSRRPPQAENMATKARTGQVQSRMKSSSPTRKLVGGLSRRGTSKTRFVCNSAFLKNLHRLSVVQIVQTSHLFCTSNFVSKINHRQISVRASAPCENSRKPFQKPKSTALPRTIPVSEQSVGTHGGPGSKFAGQTPCHATAAHQDARS